MSISLNDIVNEPTFYDSPQTNTAEKIEKKNRIKKISTRDNNSEQPKTNSNFINARQIIESCNNINVRIVPLDAYDVNKDKNMVFVTTTKPVEVLKHENLGFLYVPKDEIEEVLVLKSGIICKGKKYRSYIDKSRTIVFQVDENMYPIKKFIIKKCTNKIPVLIPVEDEKKFNFEELKFMIFKNFSFLYKKIETLTSDIQVLKRKIFEFLSTKKDYYYQLKLDNILYQSE